MASGVVFPEAPLFLLAVGQSSASGPGTTNNIQDIFHGRCVNFGEIEYLAVPVHKTTGTDLDLMPRVQESCEDLWADVSAVFAYKDACDVSVDAYLELISRIQQQCRQVPADMSMFWEGVYDLVHKFSDKGRRYVTIEDTITGFLGDKITDTIERYCGAASVNFARAASGHVRVMLSGSNPELKAYRWDSYLEKYELPNMTDTGNKFTALIIHEKQNFTK
ncbi:ADP-ribosyl cyclase/cyclic ADP-ribose hydrolase-like [Aplysia californica]|uniref:ADP-ribosyl cyclase/cyclic ADP-ribose hydrolase-like n=1 Tax=Aplysia californica TaxID=6500 RepID=A0ABM0ZX37_APLCA|nr:ADP-ribosyl cyclase/cyclic ADP-ribose hydrolase-like [Aplysia californica]